MSTSGNATTCKVCGKAMSPHWTGGPRYCSIWCLIRQIDMNPDANKSTPEVKCHFCEREVEVHTVIKCIGCDKDACLNCQASVAWGFCRDCRHDMCCCCWKELTTDHVVVACKCGRIICEECACGDQCPDCAGEPETHMRVELFGGPLDGKKCAVAAGVEFIQARLHEQGKLALYRVRPSLLAHPLRADFERYQLAASDKPEYDTI